MSNWRFKNRELIHIWIDYFKRYLDKFDFQKTRIKKLWLSLNSNFAFLSDDTFIEYHKEYIVWYNHCYIIKDKETQANLAFICLSNWQENWFLIKKSFIEVTWQGLILRNIKFYFDLLKDFDFKIEKFIRIDIAFDMEIETDYIYKRIFKDKLENKTTTIFNENWLCETCYIWKKNKTQNTYQLLRFYNKLLDNQKKWKSFLYDYQDKKNVTRFEIEIRRDKAKFWNEEKIQDIDYIFWVIVKTWYPFNYQFFKFLHLEDFKKVYETNSTYFLRKKRIEERQKDFILYWKDIKDDKELKQIVWTFITYWKRLYKNWYNLNKLVEILQKNIDIWWDFVKNDTI